MAKKWQIHVINPDTGSKYYLRDNTLIPYSDAEYIPIPESITTHCAFEDDKPDKYMFDLLNGDPNAYILSDSADDYHNVVRMPAFRERILLPYIDIGSIDKYESYKRLIRIAPHDSDRKYNVPKTRLLCVCDLTEMVKNKESFVTKPVDGAGSCDVMIYVHKREEVSFNEPNRITEYHDMLDVYSPEDVAEFIRKSIYEGKHYTPTDYNTLVQEFVDSDDYLPRTFCGVMIDGKVKIGVAQEKDHNTRFSFSYKSQFIAPSKECIDAIEQYAQQSFGMTEGVFNVEYLQSKTTGAIWVIELNSRYSATMPDYSLLTQGKIDLYNIYLHLVTESPKAASVVQIAQDAIKECDKRWIVHPTKVAFLPGKG